MLGSTIEVLNRLNAMPSLSRRAFDWKIAKFNEKRKKKIREKSSKEAATRS